MSRRLVRLALGAVAVVALGACNLAGHVTVEPDGSGTYAMTVTVDNAGASVGDSLYKTVKAALAKSGLSLDVKPYAKGAEGGAQLSFAFRSIADLEKQSERLAKAGSGLGGVKVSRDNVGWHFVSAPSKSEGFGADSGPGTNGSTGGPIDAASLKTLLHMSVVIDLPGAPGANNATAVTHDATTSTFSWDLPLGRSATPLQADTTFVGDQASVRLASGITPVVTHAAAADATGGSGGGTARAIAIAAAVAVALGAVVVVRRRRTHAVA